MKTLPSATEIHETILATARRQLATTRQGKALAAAGMSEIVEQLITAIAGNAAMALRDAIDIAIEA